MTYDSKRGMYAVYTVEEDAQLLDWLIANLKGLSTNKDKETLHGRGIKVNGKIVTQFDYPLTRGMKISVSKSKKNDTFKSRYVNLVYEDPYLVVIEKKPGILSMAAGHKSLNVKTVLDDYFRQTKQRCTAHVVHRLDRDTSGLMVYAKDMQTEQTLEHEWHNIVYDRRYVAVTYSSPVDNGGKYAVTHFHVLDRTTEHSLVEYKLETGRKNQIRVHSADMNHPVCGDVKYGNGDDPIHRLCLHAYMLHFFHPVTRARMEFETPIPSQFRMLFK